MAARSARVEAEAGLRVSARHAQAIARIGTGVDAENEAADRAIEGRRVAVAADTPEEPKTCPHAANAWVGRVGAAIAFVAANPAAAPVAGAPSRLANRSSTASRGQPRVVERRRNRAGVDLARQRAEGLPAPAADWVTSA